MPLSNFLHCREAASLFLAGLAPRVGHPRLERPLTDAQAMVDRDMTLLARVMGAGRPGLRWRSWQNSHCLVVPRHWSRLPGFDLAVEQCPLPVVLRVSGGSAVVHGPHILNLSLAWLAAEADGIGIDRGYVALTEPMIAALGEMGISAGLSRIRGAYCDGSYNLVQGERKLAGTAGVIRPAAGLRGLLLHACMSLAVLDTDLDAIIAFERCLGRPAEYRLDAHVGLADLLAAGGQAMASPADIGPQRPAAILRSHPPAE